MKRVSLVVAILLGSSAHADTTRPAVDAAFAESLAGIKQCGKTYRGTIEWATWDALDWTKTDRSKPEALDYEKTSIESVGDGIDAACRDDADCKAVLGQVDTISFRVTSKKEAGLSASVEGKTLVVTDFPFGGTRFVDDFHREVARACAAASLPSAATPPAAKRPAGRPAGVKPSSAWDGAYRFHTGGGSGGLCPRPDGIDRVTVTGGKLSVPWNVDDWHRSDSSSHGFHVGHLDGIVQADGTVAATPQLDAAIAQSRTVGTVRQKRQLDTAVVTMRFTRGDGGDKVFGLRVAYPDRLCAEDWHTRLPAIAATPRGPAKAAAPPPTGRPAEPRHAEDHTDHHSECVGQCWTVVDRCNERCREDDDAATRRCNDAKSSCKPPSDDDTLSCSSALARCLSDSYNQRNYTCEPRCKQDESTCLDACNH